jgi:hypothetical protein
MTSIMKTNFKRLLRIFALTYTASRAAAADCTTGTGVKVTLGSGGGPHYYWSYDNPTLVIPYGAGLSVDPPACKCDLKFSAEKSGKNSSEASITIDEKTGEFKFIATGSTLGNYHWDIKACVGKSCASNNHIHFHYLSSAKKVSGITSIDYCGACNGRKLVGKDLNLDYTIGGIASSNIATFPIKLDKVDAACTITWTKGMLKYDGGKYPQGYVAMWFPNALDASTATGVKLRPDTSNGCLKCRINMIISVELTAKTVKGE